MTRESTIRLSWLTGGLFGASCGGGPLKAPEGSLEDSGAPAADSAQPVDADGDGWGDPGVTASGCPRSGWVADPGDCDDGDPSANPGQLFDGCDGVDSDCDGDVDEDSKAGWELVTVDTNNGVTLAIDPATAALSSFATVSTAENINTMDVNENGMAVVHVNTLEELALFDACTGAWTSIGAHGIGSIGGIAFGPGGRLFGIGGGDTLYEFDLTTAAATEIGPLGIDITTSGLAWDCTTQTLYGADGGQDVVFEVDVNTGAATNIRRTSVPFSAVGLEFDRVSGDLLASTANRLYTIDPTTGSSTYIGYFSRNHADDLAWHPTCP